MKLTKLSDQSDVYELDYSDEDGAAELTGDIHHVRFQNEDDVSVRDAFADRMACTVVVAKGSAFTDQVSVSDDDGHEITGEVSFS